jgi:glycosyltransferase involved in cell wall biosynthesis
MNVGIDAQSLYTESRYHGMGRYTYNLVESILKNDPKNHYFLLGIANPAYPEVRFQGRYESCVIKLDGYDPGALSFSEDARQAYSRRVIEIVERNDIEAYHLTSGLSPDVIFPDPPPKGLIVTVYDLIPIVLSYLSNWPPRLVVDYVNKLNLLKRYAKRIIAISQNTKDDLVRHLDIPEKRIDVVPLGVHSKFVQSNNQIRGPPSSGYILYVGGYEYRKNVEGLIRAYSKLAPKIRARYELVLDCEENSKLKDLCVSYGIAKSVRYASPKSDEELLDLYRKSVLFVYPSLYEGFGLPPIEAMSLGVPVVTSRVSSIPEIVGDAALLADPRDPDEIARKIEAVLKDENLRANLVKKGFERAKRFSWDTCAKNSLETYDKVAHAPRIKRSERREYRIAYFSPLNPQVSGISDYSEELLRELKNHFEIDLFVDGFVPTSKEILDSFKIYDMSEFESRQEIYDIAVYHIGNNPLHLNIYRMMQRHPGIQVLHDTNLHTWLYHSFISAERRPLEYLEEIGFSCGEEGVLEGRRVIDGGYPMFQRFPLNKKALLFSLGTIVFTTMALKDLAPRSRARTVCIPHGVKSIYYNVQEGAEKKQKLREAYGIPANELMISTVGFLSFERRLVVCLRAFARLRDLFPGAKYHIAGTFLSDAVKTQLFEEMRKMKIDQYVVVSEFGKDAGRIDDYVAMSDIIVNLRYPANGGASGTVARAFAHGKPVVASAIPEFEDYPGDCTWKVDVGEYEVELLFAYLSRLCADPGLREVMGNNALKYARACDYGKIARKYADFMKDVIVNQQRN